MKRILFLMFLISEVCLSQSITNVNPNSGNQGQSMSLTISGTNMNYFTQWSGTLSPFQFLQNSTSSSFFGTPTSASGNNLYGNVSIPSTQQAGWYDLEVFDNNTNNWIMMYNAFEVTIIPIYGCTDPTACNYNPLANTDDGSCIYNLIVAISQFGLDLQAMVFAGTGPYTYQWNTTETSQQITPTANGTYWVIVEDINQCISDTVYFNVTWIPIYYGCTDPTACNYNPLANTDDGSCTGLLGCTNPTAFNYNPNATCDDSSCIPTVYGCLDSLANNYNPNANYTGFEISDTLTTLGEVINTIPLGTILLPDGSTNSIPPMPGITQNNTFLHSFPIPLTFSQGYLLIEVFNGFPTDLANVHITVKDANNNSTIASFSFALITSNSSVIDSLSLSGMSIYSLTEILNNMDINASNGPVLIDYSDAVITKLIIKQAVFAEGDFCAYVGCTDSTACNYNPLANTDDGSCTGLLGCTNPTAFNYNPNATCDDGSCLTASITNVNPNSGNQGQSMSLTISGSGMNFNQWSGTLSPFQFLQNSTASSFSGTPTSASGNNLYGNINIATNQQVGWYDLEVWDNNTNNWIMMYNAFEVTIIPIYGCTDTLGCNYDSLATVDDGSCSGLFGCTDSTACNYDPSATCDDGYCSGLLGCTDSTAINYNPLGTCDDSTCYYCSITTNVIPWLSTSLSACNGFISVTPSGTAPYTYSWSNGNTTNFNNNLCDGAYTYTVIDANGCGFTETIILTNYVGCTDSTAFNYDPTAIVDDGSCIPIIYGCMDSTALNYYSAANMDDGSCIAFVYGCTDSTATNYNANANIDDGSCTYCYAVADIGNDSITACDSALISVNTIINGTYVWSTSNISNSATAQQCPTNESQVVVLVNPQTSSAQIQILLWNPTQTDPDYIFISNPASITSDTICALNSIPWELILYSMNGSPWVDGYVEVWQNGTLIGTYSNTTGSTNTISITFQTDTTNSDTTNSVMISTSGWNYITVTDSLGCMATDSVYVHIDICGCTDSTALNYNPSATSDDGSCIATVYGCMDSTAIFYNPNANTDDGTCIYCDISISQLAISPNVAGNCDGWIYAQATSSYPPITYTWSNSFVGEFNMFLCTGVYSVTITDAYGCTVDTTINVGNVVLGCTDSTAINYDPLATIDDGSCTYACAPVTGVYMSDVIHDRAVFNWDNMNSSTCQVDQIRIRYREVGTSGYTNKTMGAPVGSGCNTANISKRILGLSPSTTYEYDFKLWYCGASTVNWHAGGAFTTAVACDNVTNVTATPVNTTKTSFCWTAPSSPYSFVRLQYRENVPGSSFSNIGGFGVFSPTLCKDKNGLTPGTQYRVMYRTWCSATGGPYRSPVWDGPVLWTQPSVIRLEGENTAITNLGVYPNPSRDIFNITFTSNEKQDLEIRIINVIGENIFIESKQQFVGEYTKQISLGEYPKAIYFLEIETDEGVINKKLILQ